VLLCCSLFIRALPGGTWHPLQEIATNSTGLASVDADANGIIDESDDVECISPPCVNSTEVAFNYANSNSKGGPATDLVCNGCVDGSDINTTVVQSRVGDTCVGGTLIRSVDEDGTVLCTS
jgi:hypothetical protein